MDGSSSMLKLLCGKPSKSAYLISQDGPAMYLKTSLEDDSSSCLWSQHLWGAVEASTLLFISSCCRKKGGKVRGDLELGSPTHCCTNHDVPSLALGTDYHHIRLLLLHFVAVVQCQILIGVSGGFFPTFSFSFHAITPQQSPPRQGKI